MSENRRGVDSHCSFIIIIFVVHVRISVLNDIFVQLGSCYFLLCYVEISEGRMNEWKVRKTECLSLFNAHPD